MPLEQQITVLLCLLYALLREPLGCWEGSTAGADSSGTADDIVYNHTPAHLKHV